MFLLAHPHRQGVKSSDEKPTQDRCEDQLSQSTEFRQIIEEYANDLREIVKKLLGRLIEARRAGFRPLKGTDCRLVRSCKSLRAGGAGRKPRLANPQRFAN